MSGDTHLTQDLMLAFLRGQVPPERLIETLLSHVHDSCSICRQELARLWLTWRCGGQEEILTRRLLTLARFYKDRFGPARLEAESEVLELLELPAEERQSRVAGTPERFCTPFLVDLLIQEGRQRMQSAPRQTLELASLAVEVALRVDHESYGSGFGLETLARAMAHKGNALRVLGELRLAEEALGFARSVLNRAETGDPLVEAEVLRLLASLRRDQRRMQEASELLAQVISVYRQMDEKEQLARALVKQSCVLRHSDPHQAVRRVVEALELLDPEADRELFLCARFNLALYLTDTGRYREARGFLTKHIAELFEIPDCQVRLRLRWLEARIAHGLGEHTEAEIAYCGARDGYLAEGIGHDAALVSLDLAALYLEQGRTDEVRALTEEMLPAFQAQDVHREAAAALTLFCEAVRLEAVTLDTVRGLATYLEQARHDRSLHYEHSLL